jgi:hypothetical protein
MYRSRTVSVTITIGDVTYEVDCMYTAGSPPTYDDPGDGGEIETPRFVSYWIGNHQEEITWATLVLEYAAHYVVAREEDEFMFKVRLDWAESLLTDALRELASDALSDDDGGDDDWRRE